MYLLKSSLSLLASSIDLNTKRDMSKNCWAVPQWFTLSGIRATKLSQKYNAKSRDGGNEDLIECLEDLNMLTEFFTHVDKVQHIPRTESATPWRISSIGSANSNFRKRIGHWRLDLNDSQTLSHCSEASRTAAKLLHTKLFASIPAILLATSMRDWRRSTNGAASGKNSLAASGVTGSGFRIS